MRFLSNVTLRAAVPLATILVVSACSDSRVAPLSQVEVVDIPVADTGPQSNQNINNPTLTIPETFPVSDGDLLTLVWSEEFDDVNLDPEVWFFATGDGTEKGLPGGWGNNELQHYLPDNAMLVNGALEITARRETVGDLDYTSARINTEDRFAVKYGRIEASIKLPAGQGIWPAFWMLSQDSAYQCDGQPCDWAATGEIDIMEAVNLDATGGNEIYGTIHYGGEAPANTSSGTTFTPSVDVTADFHTYAVEWDEFEMRWYFDGQLYAMQNAWFSTAAPYPAPFDQPFHILLNVAVGGDFPGSPDATTPFPLTMAVDWVRVYSGEPPPPLPPPPPFDSGLLTNGGFEAGVDPWIGNAANVVDDGGNLLNSADVAVAGDAFAVNLSQVLTITQGETYTLTFKARSDGMRTMLAGIGLNEAPFSNVTEVVNLTADWQTFEFEFTAAEFGNANSRVLFDMGADTGLVLIDDVSLVVSTGGGPGAPFDSGLLTNGDFEAGIDPWIGNAANVAVDGGNNVNSADVAVAGDAFAVNLSQVLTITQDETYTLTFKARSDGMRTILAGIGLNEAPFSNVTEIVDLTAVWQTFQFEFTAAGFGNANSRVLFDMGADTGLVLIDDVSLVVSGGGGPAAGDIAANGGFETGDFSGWEAFPNGGIQAITSTNPSAGTFAANLNVPVRVVGDPAVDNLIKNANLEAGNLTPGASVTVSFDMRGLLSGTGGVVFAEFFSELSGGGTSKAVLFTDGPLAPNVDWTNYSFTTTMGPDVNGGVTLQLKTSCGPVVGCGVDAYFDNVSIVLN